jgi:hypothetical protein
MIRKIRGQEYQFTMISIFHRMLYTVCYWYYKAIAHVAYSSAGKYFYPDKDKLRGMQTYYFMKMNTYFSMLYKKIREPFIAKDMRM